MSENAGPHIPEYRLRLTVDPAALRWTGTVEFDPPTAGEPLELDCDGLEVREVRGGGRPIGCSPDPAARRLSLTVPHGEPQPIAVDFSGAVETTNLYGLYRSRQGSGHLLTTHCEPAGARKIFPCLDRPDRKARIALSVQAPADLEVITNTPVRSTQTVAGGREWTFEPTPEMSTYLFYLGIGRFDWKEDRSGRVAIRVATAPGRGEAGLWALRSARRILAAYEAYYGLPYPLPKLDLIAIAEHSFGAMENWGAISFQETRLLVDAASSSFAPHDVFLVAAHEIAHQWFGNLVTMTSWDDVWLNESFASLMETKITEQLEPSFDPWADFMLRTMGKSQALDGDSLRSTHPIRTHVEQPEELSQIFDEISYGKGSSVLAMLDRYLGEERFRAGVTDYLGRFRYRNARTEDLLASLERASGEPVGAVAGPWVDRPGVPVVSARLARDGITLSQARFSYLDGAKEQAPWPIPMVIEVDGRSERLLFNDRTHPLRAPAGATVVLNPGSIGYYRVLYDRALLDRLLAVLPGRPALDAWSVLEDLGAFVLSGDVDWATYDRAVRALADRTDRVLAETFAAELPPFALLFPVPAVVRTVTDVLGRQLERIGLERRDGEPATVGISRDRLTYARARVDPAFAAELAPRFDRWNEVDPDLRMGIAVARARTGGADAFAELLRARDRASSDAEEIRLELGLAWSPDPGLVRDLLDRAIRGEVNRSHIFRVALQAGANPHGRDVTWTWLRENLEKLAGIFRGSGYLPFVLEYLLPYVARGREAEVRAFFAGRTVPEGSRGLAKGLERVEVYERLARRLG